MESTDHVGVRRYQVCFLTPSNLEVRAHRSYQGDFKIQNGDSKVQAECKIFSKSARPRKSSFWLDHLPLRYEAHIWWFCSTGTIECFGITEYEHPTPTLNILTQHRLFSCQRNFVYHCTYCMTCSEHRSALLLKILHSACTFESPFWILKSPW